jgi:hypothetical protein
MTQHGHAETDSALAGCTIAILRRSREDAGSPGCPAHALRYQVYCVEHAFEDPSQQIGERERDRDDDRAVHAVLIRKSTERVVVASVADAAYHGRNSVA